MNSHPDMTERWCPECHSHYWQWRFMDDPGMCPDCQLGAVHAQNCQPDEPEATQASNLPASDASGSLPTTEAVPPGGYISHQDVTGSSPGAGSNVQIPPKSS